MGIQLRSDDGVAEVVIDFPPVNALPVAGWFEPVSYTHLTLPTILLV